jgi:hypothetical protein
MSYREAWRIRGIVLRLLLLSFCAVAPAIGYTATYYVHSGGDDSADGRSHDSAWQSLDRVKAHSFMASDAVFFFEGERWQGQLIVNWSGTASRAAIVGAYHLENGVPVRGYRLRRPVIDGADAVPQQFDGLVRVRGDYVRVENLEVVNSEGRGIQFEDAQFGAVVDCVTANSYKSGIKFIRSPNALISGNFVTRAGVAFPEDGGVWGGAIELVASDGGVVRENTVTEVYGEGINANHGSTGTTIESNYVFAARAVGIYVDAAPNTTVRRNIVVGTSNSEFWTNGQSSGTGVALNNESYHYAQHGGDLPLTVQSQGARIYNNVVAYTTSGVGFWGQLDATTFDNVLVFNNTLVDNEVQLIVRQKPKPGARFINNVLLSLSPSTQDVDRPDLAGMAAHSNYLSQGDPGGDLSDTRNIYQGLVLARMTGWRAITARDQITWRDFNVSAGSSVIGAGDDEPLLTSQGDDTYDHDFNGLPHNAPLDMGALHFSAVPIKTPKRPTRIGARP